MKFVFSPLDPQYQDHAKSLLFIDYCVPEGDPNHDALLVLNEDGLGIHEPKRWQQPAFVIDFTTMDIRTGAGNLSRKQPLARAVGRQSERVLDLTSGFGSDTTLLAGMGFRSSVANVIPSFMHSLQDALQRAASHPLYSEALSNNIRLQFGDAKDVGSSFLRAFDAVYVDPMYPPKKSKSGAPTPAGPTPPDDCG